MLSILNGKTNSEQRQIIESTPSVTNALLGVGVLASLIQYLFR